MSRVRLSFFCVQEALGILRQDHRKIKERQKEVRIKSVVINLTAEQTLRLTRILVDEDQEEALTFLKDCLKPQLDHATRDH